jgi:Domain of unknown function (DUF4337)
MSEAPEIPEAKDPFEKRAALTISIVAICLTFIGNLGDNAKTEAIIRTNQSSDQWGYFQAKGIKGQMAAMQASVLSALAGPNATDDIRADVARLKKEADRYESEKADIKKEAERLHQEAAKDSAINDRCDQASLSLQLSVVFCSVSILARSHRLWYVGIVLGVIGAVIGVTAFLI